MTSITRTRNLLLEQAVEAMRAWGGPAVLKQRGVVEELLRLQEKGGP